MLATRDAIDRVLDDAPGVCLGPERVDVREAIGRVTAEPTHARWSLPGAPLSIMDGYAVRSAELIAARDEFGAETLAQELASESAAGHPSEGPLEPGACVRIATGAVLPDETDAVVPQEDTRRIELPPGDRNERVLIEFSETALRQVRPGRWVRAIGSDVREGELLLEAGVVVGPGEASLLAAAGHAELAVARRPIVAILGSGDELVPIGSEPRRGQVVSTNSMMLAAMIREAGGEPLDLGPVPDRAEAVVSAIERGRGAADLIVGTGGISVGDHDLVLPALDGLGFELGFRRVALRPGRPTTYGRLPRAGERDPMPVLALPGNPASTLVAFELFARPLIRSMLGLPRYRWERPRRAVELARPAEGDLRREHWVRARIDASGRALPATKQLSGALRSIARLDALVRIPAGSSEIAAGERLEAIFVRE
jgi:molybdopterin molybdotransferase